MGTWPGARTGALAAGWEGQAAVLSGRTVTLLACLLELSGSCVRLASAERYGTLGRGSTASPSDLE